MTGDVLARIDAALAEVDAAPAPPDDVNAYGLSWETEAGKWTADLVGSQLHLFEGQWEAALVAVTRSQDLCDFNEAARASYRERVLAPVTSPRRPGRAGQVSPYGPPGRTVRDLTTRRP